ncbi:MAG: hypothetical protein BA867_11000 [Desulfobacterales bacterium S5133MH16]|nr:MAG: hypothetical protein BA867_11000 [Desulfobacterales bacterium S5133MH16]
MDKNKRQFLTDYPRLQAGNFIESFRAGLQTAREREEIDKFFESYESSYALTLAYPDDILLETARMNGIKTEGREKIDIVKELILMKGPE